MNLENENGGPAPNPERGRAHRSDEVRGARRRRDAKSLNRMVGMNLQIFDASQLDTQNFVYRWACDAPGRLHTLTKLDDYDFVDTSEIPGFVPMQDGGVNESDTRVRMVMNQGAQVGTYGYLLKKPKNFWQEDNDQLVEMRSSMMERRVYEGDLSGPSDAPAENSEHLYVPQGNVVGHAGEHVVNPNRRRGRIG